MDIVQIFIHRVRTHIDKGELKEAIEALRPVLKGSPLFMQWLDESSRVYALIQALEKNRATPQITFKETVTISNALKGILDQLETSTPTNLVRKEVQKVLEQNKAQRRLLLIILIVVVCSLVIILLKVLSPKQASAISQTIQVVDISKQKELPAPRGILSLTYTDKVARDSIKQPQNVFTGIPSHADSAILRFRARSFQTIERKIKLSNQVYKLEVMRDSSLAWVKGVVKDETGMPIPEARIVVQDMVSRTDSLGRFALPIPPEKQKFTQRIEVYHEEYRPLSELSPVSRKGDIQLQLLK